MTDIRMKFSPEEYPNMHQNGSGFYQKEEGIPLNKEELDFFSKEKEEPSIIDKVIESINDFFAPAEEITEEIPTEIQEVEPIEQFVDKNSVQRYVKNEDEPEIIQEVSFTKKTTEQGNELVEDLSKEDKEAKFWQSMTEPLLDYVRENENKYNNTI